MTASTAGMAKVARWVVGFGATGLSDRELLARFTIAQDQIAFEALVKRHTRMVLGVCRRVLSCAQDAEDACQAVFLLLAEKAARVNWQTSVAGWLYTAARKVARNAQIAAKRRSRRENLVALSKPTSTVDDLSGRELMRLLDEELDRLAAHYREPLILCYLEGLTQDEAAHRLDVPQATLKSQLKRARQKLATALGARGCELGAVLLAVAAFSTKASAANLCASIMAAVAGAPSHSVRALARCSLVGSLANSVRLALLATIGASAAIGIALAMGQAASKTPESQESPPALLDKQAAVLSRIGTGRFRAEHPIEDARYSADGKSIVGCAGASLYVWNAASGQLLRKLATGLELLNDPTAHNRRELLLAVHPKKNLMACGGQLDGKIHLQLWNFETGQRLADKESRCDALKLLSWTPGGENLLERTNVGYQNPGAQRLIARNEKLEEEGLFDLPADTKWWSTVMLPLPGGKQVLLWHGESEPTFYDIEFGKVRGSLPHKQGSPSGLAISPDAKLLAATSTEDIRLLEFPSGDVHKVLPVLRSSWEKPRPLFSPDGKTLYVWDHRPIAYDVSTGEEKWKASSRTVHTVRMELCDVSPDGKHLLIRQGHGLALYDAKTGLEQNPAETPSLPSGIVWSPDNSKIFSRTSNHDRTWTAWDAKSGQRLYDMQPTGFVENDDWKMNPDLFFIEDGKKIIVVAEHREATEGTGSKELLVFDAANGKCLKRLGTLPKEIFQWMYPIGVHPGGKLVLMQAYAISAANAGAAPGTPSVVDMSKEFSYRNVLWDPEAQKIIQDWLVHGDRTDDPRHYLGYYVTVREKLPTHFPRPLKDGVPAKIRCYSLSKGKLVHELQTDSLQADTDSIVDDFLLTCGNDGTWIVAGNSTRWQPEGPYRYELWDLPTESTVGLFELPEKTPVALAPQGQFVVRVKDAQSLEIYEPFVLKKAVAKINTPSRAKKFEFSADGKQLAVSLADTSILILDATSWRSQIEGHIAREVPADPSSLYESLSKEPASALRAARLLAVAGNRVISDLEKKAIGSKDKNFCHNAVRTLRWLNTPEAKAL